MYNEFAVSIPDDLNKVLLDHLIRDDGQEDLCFALYAPSLGSNRKAVLINEIILPQELDRQVHGNVSFNEVYFKRVCALAMSKGMGLCFLHSHPFPGWQSMSDDDIKAETKMAPTVESLTNLPLVGLTTGSDGTWSARVWEYSPNDDLTMQWVALVKSVGALMRISYNDRLLPPTRYREQFKRTRTVYGVQNHQTISRLTVGIIGLGSVGSLVAEMLARMGIRKFVLIDFDIIKEHNLDRQSGSTTQDVGKLKITVAEELIRRSATCENVSIETVNSSIALDMGYRKALDCDVLFSCVDRPLPRYILNHIAYSHLIPVIDGGIKVRFVNSEFQTAEWQLQTVTVGKPCLQCLGIYQPSEVDLERNGKLDDPSYMAGLNNDHHLKTNENIFPFSANLASMEIFHLIALCTQIGGAEFNVQRYRFVHGIISNYHNDHCDPNCAFVNGTATGDHHFSPLQ